MNFGEAAQFSPYSPSPKGDTLAFGHPTAGASELDACGLPNAVLSSVRD
ncbi:MAG: hypothetical protein V7K20_23940 [Nostoc sp.]